MRHSPIDKRSKRYAPRQCLSDTGHKDAEIKLGLTSFCMEPLKQYLERLRRKKQRYESERDDA